MARRKELHNGQAVRVRLISAGGGYARATIERVHTCWSVVSLGASTVESLRSDDDLPMTLACIYGSSGHPRDCVHVRYRNNHRNIVWCCYVHPMNAIDELAGLASDPAPPPFSPDRRTT